MIVYFSGTGNSRFVAEKIAEQAGHGLFDAALGMREEEGKMFPEDDCFVFVCPVYVSAPVLPFLEFIKRSAFPEGSRAYFVMTCAGGMGASPIYCQRLAEEKGLRYMGTASVRMPQNYVPFFRMLPEEETRERIRDALPVISRISENILQSKRLPAAKIRSWEKAATGAILRLYYRRFMSPKPFRSTESCIHCGRCERVCPMGNIRLKEGRPAWGKRCIHCMACINLCPAEAVEYGRWTRGKLRFHGPEHYINR